MTEKAGREFKRTLRLIEKDDHVDFDTLVCKRLRGMNKNQVTEWVREAVRDKFTREQLAIAAAQGPQILPVAPAVHGVFSNLLKDAGMTHSNLNTRVISDE